MPLNCEASNTELHDQCCLICRMKNEGAPTLYPITIGFTVTMTCVYKISNDSNN
jgi:hypothetical protein